MLLQVYNFDFSAFAACTFNSLVVELFFSMFLIIQICNKNKKVSAISVIETHREKKLIKLFRDSSIEIKVDIVRNLLWLRFYKDKNN